MTDEKLTVGRQTVELSNTGKVLFPRDGITKGDLVEYYQAVAGEMLPLLRDRPVSMTRFPDGVGTDGIVQKNVPAYFPDWITRVPVRKEGGSLRQVVCRSWSSSMTPVRVAGWSITTGRWSVWVSCSTAETETIVAAGPAAARARGAPPHRTSARSGRTWSEERFQRATWSEE